MKKGVRSLLVMSLVTVVMAMTGCGKQVKQAPSTTQEPVTLTISAAASLTEVMGEIKTLYKVEKPNVTLDYNIAGSGTLQKQIEQGADVDLFFSAGTKQMDVLQNKRLLIDDTEVNLVGNSVVLIVKTDSTLDISDFKDASVTKLRK